jgi:hypothetical protein
VEEMKNKEKYAKKIIDAVTSGGYGFGFNKYSGEIRRCNEVPCDECLFCDLDGVDECNKVKREWAESEYIEKPVISKRDRAFLEYIDKRYEYLARDKTGQLYVHRVKPHKVDSFWTNAGRRFCLNDRINVDFPMVKLEDSEPWLIEDLKKLEVVEEYE